MNKEYVSSKAFGVDFLDDESGERIVQITPMTENNIGDFYCLALTNLGSLYLLDVGRDLAERFKPVLKSKEVESA